jgi:hypothetical protein
MHFIKLLLMKRLLIIFLTTGFLSSCSIEEEATSFVNPDNYYLTEAQIVSGLNSTYIPLKTIYTYTYLIATEGVTDVMKISSGTLDAQLDISPAQPRFGSTMWTQGYRGVMYCNSIIAAIKRSPLDESVKNRLLAEGMIMRAYYYWFLTSTFGDVPFYTEDVADAEVLDRISVLGRMPAVETRKYLIEELIKYVPYLPQTRTNDVAGNRSGAAMGWMLIGKLAQWNKQWTVAKESMDKLEQIYGNLNQYPLEEIMFKTKNTRESIFEVQFAYSETGLQVTTNAAAITMPTRGTGSIYDGVDVPELGSTATTWTPLRPNNYFFQSIQRKNSEDLRTKLNMAWDYKGVAFKSTTAIPWLGPKFWSFNMYNTADGNNQKVFRYADALLMQAENYMELGNVGESIRYLNMVRGRAGLQPYTFRNLDLLREEIQKERARELLGEYQRKYDLVRWGIWYKMTYDYTDYATLKTNILPCHEYYPIPDLEVVKSGYKLDNKAYEFYGKN